jgi:3',5'-cyclic AMP phosphodiesterase CpdA
VDFVAVGDTGTTDAGGDSVANLIKGLEPDFILFLGDICHNAGAETLLDAQYTQKYGGFTPLDAYPAWGNHDLESASGGLWGGPLLDLFAAKPELAAGKFYYNFTKGPCEIFVLNSGYNLGDPREPDGITAASVQAAWLQAALAASSAPWKIVACHIAPYCSDSTHGSTAYMQWPFLAWGASLVLSGHSHVYERLVVGGLPYLVTGLGGKSKHNWGATVAGSQKRYNALYGVVRVTATEARLQCRFINELGQTYDRVIYEV